MIIFQMTPGIWFIVILIAGIIDYFIKIPEYLNPMNLGPILTIDLAKRFGGGGEKRLRGLLLWLLVILSLSIIYFYVNLIFRKINFFLFLILVIFSLITVLGGKNYLKKQENSIEFFKKENLHIDLTKEEKKNFEKSKLNLFKDAEVINELSIGCFTYMFIGIITSYFTPAINPLTLSIIYKAAYGITIILKNINKELNYYPKKIFAALNYVPKKVNLWLINISAKLLGFNTEVKAENKKPQPNKTPFQSCTEILSIKDNQINSYDIDSIMEIGTLTEVLVVSFYSVFIFIFIEFISL